MFGYLKRVLGYRKARYMGLKGETELLLKSTVYNIVRAVKLADGPERAFRRVRAGKTLPETPLKAVVAPIPARTTAKNRRKHPAKLLRKRPVGAGFKTAAACRECRGRGRESA